MAHMREHCQPYHLVIKFLRRCRSPHTSAVFQAGTPCYYPLSSGRTIRKQRPDAFAKVVDTSFKVIGLQSDWLRAGTFRYVYHLHYIAVGHLPGPPDKNCLITSTIKQFLQPAF